MKIAILTPKSEKEAETFIQNHIKFLPFEKVVIYGGDLPYKINELTDLQFAENLYAVKRKVLNRIGIKSYPFHEKCLEDILKKEKVEMVFAEYLTTAAETLMVCKRLNIPVIAIALGYEISVYHILKSYKKKYEELFKYAKNIVIVSEHMKTNLLSLGCPKGKIVYSPAAPSEEFFEVIPNFSNKQLLSIGRFVDKKAPHLTLLAFREVLIKHPDCTLVMAGDGELLNVCRDLVAAFNMQESVTFIGRIDQEKQRELLAASYIFIQHSKDASNGDSEGTPVAILEASAAGLPVVSTIHAGIPRVILDKHTGILVAEGDYKEMATAIIHLLDNPEIAKEMGLASKKYISETFTLKSHIETISNLITN